MSATPQGQPIGLPPPSTHLSACGRCFFQGREFFVDPLCLIHGKASVATIVCESCGLPEAAELIDAKPSDGDFECGDYDRMECIACYGPGYDMLSWDHAKLSVRPELAGLYDYYIETSRLSGIVWC